MQGHRAPRPLPSFVATVFLDWLGRDVNKSPRWAGKEEKMGLMGARKNPLSSPWIRRRQLRQAPALCRDVAWESLSRGPSTPTKEPNCEQVRSLCGGERQEEARRQPSACSPPQAMARRRGRGQQGEGTGHAGLPTHRTLEELFVSAQQLGADLQGPLSLPCFR